jgi:hypothetical protein
MERFDLLPVGLFGLLVLLESLRPGRARGRRWLANGGLLVANGLLAAVIVQQATHDDVPAWPVWIAGVLFMDLVHYAGHRLMHAVPLLWRVHVVHHNDLDLDVTTALRTHPIEFVVLYGLSWALAALAGVPAVVMAGYGLVLLGVEMLQHARLTLPDWLERSVRWVVVTPGYHRLHHSPERAVHDSNYGRRLPPCGTAPLQRCACRPRRASRARSASRATRRRGSRASSACWRHRSCGPPEQSILRML